MAKLETAAQFISLMEEGKYDNAINAKRAAGRTHLSEGEKKKAFAAIEAHFGSDEGAAPAAKKKAAKKKKKAAKKAVAKPEAPVDAAVPKKKVGKKKVTKKAATRSGDGGEASVTPPPGTLPISPGQVKTVSDMIQVIDSTVARSMSIMTALQRADEIHKAGDISEGVRIVKETLVGAARLLQDQVVAPLRHVGAQADSEVATRLEAVVRASNDPFQGDQNAIGAALAAPPPLETSPS